MRTLNWILSATAVIACKAKEEPRLAPATPPPSTAPLADAPPSPTPVAADAATDSAALIDAPPDAASASADPAAALAGIYCTQLNANPVDGFQKTACAESAAACAKEAAGWKDEVSARPSPCEPAPRMFCYVSKVEGEDAIRSCHLTLADRVATRKQEAEHNRTGPILTKCLEKHVKAARAAHP